MDHDTMEYMVLENRIADLGDRLDYITEYVCLPVAEALYVLASNLAKAKTSYPDEGPWHGHNVFCQTSGAVVTMGNLLNTLRHDIDHIHAEEKEDPNADARLAAFIARSAQLQDYLARTSLAEDNGHHLVAEDAHLDAAMDRDLDCYQDRTD